MNVRSSTNLFSIVTQAVFEHLAFTEIVTDGGRPVLFLSGMYTNRKSYKHWVDCLWTKCYTANRETFRPYLRIKELDLLYTTETTIPWWDAENDQPNLLGLTVLIVLMMGVFLPDSGLQLTSDNVREYVHQHKDKHPKTTWNAYYDKMKEKYPDKITASKKAPKESGSNKRQPNLSKLFMSREDCIKKTFIK